MSMNTVALHDIDDLFFICAPVPEPGPGGVLLKVEVDTICDTDLRIVSGVKAAGTRPGVILGHKFAGKVATIGEGVEGVDVGVQATCSIVLSCGRCLQCLAGREHLYENSWFFGYETDGGFAEYLLVLRKAMGRGNLVLAPRELKPAVFVPTEPISCCLNGARQSQVSPGGAVAVLGTGPIGLLHAVLAKSTGATRVMVVGCPRRLDPALALGATHALASQGEKLIREILDTTGGGTDAAIMAVGDPALANQTLEVATIGGRVNYFTGFPKRSTAVMEPNTIHYREPQVTGDPNARRADIHRAVELLSSGILDVDSLVTHRFPLTQIDAMIAAVHECAGLKVAVVPD